MLHPTGPQLPGALQYTHLGRRHSNGVVLVFTFKAMIPDVKVVMPMHGYDRSTQHYCT